MFSTQQVQNDVPLTDPPTDSVSKIAFSSKWFDQFYLLAVASWDNMVRIYQVDAQCQSKKLTEYSHDQPVLDLCWSTDGETLYSAGADNCIKAFTPRNLTTPPVVIGQHQAPVKAVRYFMWKGTQPMVVSAGWDHKLMFWDPNGQNVKHAELDLGDKAMSMDVDGRLLVVAVGSRHYTIVNLTDVPTMLKPANGSHLIESPLKWQTRVVACVPKMFDTLNDEEAFAIGSIEGRVSIQHPFHPDKANADLKKNYSFKCHRHDRTDLHGKLGIAVGKEGKTQDVFAVHTIDFHPVLGTFVTGGSDGWMNVWDGFARSRLKSYSMKDLNNNPTGNDGYEYGTPIVSTSFAYQLVDNAPAILPQNSFAMNLQNLQKRVKNNILAYAMSYDWSRGYQHARPGQTKIMLKPIVDTRDIARKEKK